MTEQFPRAKTAIVGASTFGLGEMPGWSSIELAAKAAHIALDDAGVTLGEVDALFICTPDDFPRRADLRASAWAEPALSPTTTAPADRRSSATWSPPLPMLDAGMIDVALIAHGFEPAHRCGGASSFSAARSSSWGSALQAAVSGEQLCARGGAAHAPVWAPRVSISPKWLLRRAGWANQNPEGFCQRAADDRGLSEGADDQHAAFRQGLLPCPPMARRPS